MKIALPINEDKKTICMSFGRTPEFLVIDLETGIKTFIDNQAAAASGGAGIQAAQSLVDHEVEVLLTPRCGENAIKVLNTGNIKVYRTTSESIECEVDKFKKGELEVLTQIHKGFHHHGSN